MGRKSRDRSNCRRKLCHPDYLSALLHARRLRPDDDIVIYPCRICCRLHVGHASKMSSKQPISPEKKKARLRRKITQAQQRLAQLQRSLKQLLDETKSPSPNPPNGSSGP